MKTITSIFSLLIFLLSYSFAAKSSLFDFNHPERINKEGLSIVKVSGSYQEMGRQYGKLLKPEITALYKKSLSYYQSKQAQQILQHYQKILDPREKQMLQGISETTGIKYLELFKIAALPLVFMANSPSLAKNHFGNCSFLSTNGKRNNLGTNLLARNLDFDSSIQEFLPITVLQIFKPNNGDRAIAAFSWAGVLAGHTILNGKNLFFESNDATGSIPGLNPKGLDPLHQIFYAALSSDSMMKAQNYLTSKNPYGYALSSLISVNTPTQSITIEAPSTQAAQVVPTQTNNINYFTNLFLTKNFPGEILNIHNCAGSNSMKPMRDTLSHACTRYYNIQKEVAATNTFNVTKLKDFFTLSVDKGGVYQTGDLTTFPANEITAYSIIADLAHGKLYFRQFNFPLEKWIELDFRELIFP